MPTYSVALYRLDNSEVTGFVKHGMVYHEASDCLIAVMQTISEEYGAAIVDGGSVEIGDRLTEDLTK